MYIMKFKCGLTNQIAAIAAPDFMWQFLRKPPISLWPSPSSRFIIHFRASNLFSASSICYL